MRAPPSPPATESEHRATLREQRCVWKRPAAFARAPNAGTPTPAGAACRTRQRCRARRRSRRGRESMAGCARPLHFVAEHGREGGLCTHGRFVGAVGRSSTAAILPTGQRLDSTADLDDHRAGCAALDLTGSIQYAAGSSLRRQQGARKGRVCRFLRSMSLSLIRHDPGQVRAPSSRVDSNEWPLYSNTRAPPSNAHARPASQRGYVLL